MLKNIEVYVLFKNSFVLKIMTFFISKLSNFGRSSERPKRPKLHVGQNFMFYSIMYLTNKSVSLIHLLCNATSSRYFLLIIPVFGKTRETLRFVPQLWPLSCLINQSYVMRFDLGCSWCDNHIVAESKYPTVIDRLEQSLQIARCTPINFNCSI